MEFDFQDIAILIDFESLINNSRYLRQPKLNIKLESLNKYIFNGMF